MLKFIIRIVPLFFLVAAAGGCSVFAPSLGGSEGEPSSLRRALIEEEISRLVDEEFTVPGESEAHYLFLRGQIAVAEGDLDAAREFLERAQEIEPAPAPTLRRQLAELLIQDGDLDEALEQIEKALEVDTDDLKLLKLYAGVLASKKELDKAITTYERVLTLSEEVDEEASVLLASFHSQKGDGQAAVVVLDRLLAEKEDSTLGYYYRGRVLEAMGELDSAELSYREALKLNPGSEQVQLDLARCLALKGEYEDSESLCNEVLERNPRSLGARRLLAQILVQQNKLEEAQQAFELLAEVEEQPSDTRFKIALIKLERGDLEEAIVDLRLVVADNPKDNSARYYLALSLLRVELLEQAVEQLAQIGPEASNYLQVVLQRIFLLDRLDRGKEALRVAREELSRGRSDERLLQLAATLEREHGSVSEGVKLLRRLVDLSPESDGHLFMLGVMLDELGSQDESLEVMERVIEKNPENANALNYLGYSLVERGERLEEALGLIERALEVEPDNGYFIDSLGWAYYQLGRYEDALEQLERAVSLAPDDAVILEHLSRAQLKLGDIRKASETARRAKRFVAESDDENIAERLAELLDKLEEARERAELQAERD